LSKKKFTDGLESLLNTPHQEGGQGTAFLEGAKASADQESKPSVKRPSTRKGFTTDLDSLLEEALQESFEEQMYLQREGGNIAEPKAQVFHQQAHRRRPGIGLDILIRRTVERGEIEEDKTTGTRRLTVTFDKEKLSKLKVIARMEKAYLKDILGDIVAEYIKKYEQRKGAL
jgi:hypothetical protein